MVPSANPAISCSYNLMPPGFVNQYGRVIYLCTEMMHLFMAKDMIDGRYATLHQQILLK